MEYFLQAQGLLLVDSRAPEETIISAGVTDSLMADFKEDKVIWRSRASDDELTLMSCKQLGCNMVKLIQQLRNMLD